MPRATLGKVTATSAGALCLLAAGAFAQEPVAPGKFIPSFAVKYASTEGWPPAAEAARFDLLDVSSGTNHARVHASQHGNTWQTLKRLNPHLVIILYQMGPAEYNTASWGKLGEGWEWITTHHGAGSADRWTALGARYGTYLQSRAYKNERLMVVGNPNWQRFWLEQVWANLWGGSEPIGAGADGIFADNTRYTIPWLNGWFREGHPDQPDVPAEYYRDGAYQPEVFKAEMKTFLARAVPWLAARGCKLVLNFGDMARDPAAWAELDAEPHPVFAAMEEGAFVHPWGGRGSFVFRPEAEWLNQVRTMRSLKRVRALMNVHGPVAAEAPDFGRMDSADASGNRAWDVLWYALTSFLQGYDDVRQNAYLNFTVWGYNRFYWLKEFDPAFLHLGRARGEMERVQGAAGYVYLREFDDGWAAVNPTTSEARAVPVPTGRARVLDHHTLEKPDTQPLVDRFDLPAHRGCVLLKPDRQAGNGDNR
ncbi:MAG: putative glycoside hydrolase [Armatimonadota bacterium]|nr:putative glycoside hydrolase [Armatimonadota bacterium]